MTASAIPDRPWLPAITFGDRVRITRRDLRMTQDQFADKLGVERVTLSAWETGRNKPEDLVACAKRVQLAVGVPAWWLLGIDGPGGGRARQDSNLRPEDYKSPTSVIIDLAAERARRRTSTRDVELPHVAKVLQFPSRMLAAA